MAKRSNADYAVALAMRDRGCTYREIGEEFGVTASRASQMVDRGYNLFTQPGRTSASRSFPSRVDYGRGDTAWQWRDWNEWTATPMIGRNDDNTILAAL